VFQSATPRKMSRGMRCALFGLAMTVLARLGPWSWPGWPALTLLDFVLARWAPPTVTPVAKAYGLIALLIVNAGFWALVAWCVVRTREAFVARYGGAHSNDVER
jgi:hypothetical protein